MKPHNRYCRVYIPLKYKIKTIIAILFFPYKKWETYKKKYTVVKIFRQPKLIMTLLVKNEEDILEENLKFHKNIGVDGFIITDNGSTDNTLKIIEKYKQMGWILEVIKEPNQDYNQVAWVNKMCLIARDKFKADWIINSDADEFWVPIDLNNIKKFLNPSKSLIYVKHCSMLSIDSKNWKNNTYKVINSLPTNLEERLINSNKLSKHSQISVVNKVIIQAQFYKMISMGNHTCEVYNSLCDEELSNSIVIYHYAYRGLEHFRNKVINGGRAISSNKNYSKNVGVHWRYFYDKSHYSNFDIKKEYHKVNGSLVLNTLLTNNIIEYDDTMKKVLEKL